MERVPSKDIGAGQLRYRRHTHRSTGSQLELRLPVTFHRAQNLNFWMQVYNLGIDEKSKQNGATIEYQILDMANE